MMSAGMRRTDIHGAEFHPPSHLVVVEWRWFEAQGMPHCRIEILDNEMLRMHSWQSGTNVEVIR